ncbi:MAG TPA: hypothetical protein PK095_02585 [Myxococcota bacterium]|nr:hypothetical protein [Myxococcota bacterium]
MKHLLSTLAFGAVLVTGCADPVCEPVADSCPNDCGEIRGTPLHPTCDWGHVIACVADPPGVLTTDVGCVARLTDGHVFMMSSGTLAGLLVDTGAWRHCTTEERTTDRQGCPF